MLYLIKSIDDKWFLYTKPRLCITYLVTFYSKQDSAKLANFQLAIAQIVIGARKGTIHDLLYKETINCIWKTLIKLYETTTCVSQSLNLQKRRSRYQHINKTSIISLSEQIFSVPYGAVVINHEVGDYGIPLS